MCKYFNKKKRKCQLIIEETPHETTSAHEESDFSGTLVKKNITGAHKNIILMAFYQILFCLYTEHAY